MRDKLNSRHWIDPSWHNCLIGCMICQSVCPLNRNVSDWVVDGGEFSETETEMILEGRSREELPVETAEKIRRLGLLEDLELLPRNLIRLMWREKTRQSSAHK